MELMITLAIGVVVVSVAVPTYQDYLNKADELLAEADIRQIEQDITDFFYDRSSYPETLEDMGLQDMRDPWGNPYEYLRIAAGATTASKTSPGKSGKKGGGSEGPSKGKLRKDKNLVPINTDYDLYSKGQDGRSVSPLTAKHSRDDVIRAGNGSYIGIAKYF
ncbi:MAG: hypothetical protein Hals2KO_22200 [Halioglobus sp.]